MTTEKDSSESESERQSAEDLIETEAENRKRALDRYADNRRPEWMKENFVHIRSDNGHTLSLSPKQDHSIPAVPAEDKRGIVEQYAFQLSETPETIELELDTGERFVGEVEADHVEWEQVEEFS